MTIPTIWDYISYVNNVVVIQGKNRNENTNNPCPNISEILQFLFS
jgi:hypothetical protein